MYPKPVEVGILNAVIPANVEHSPWRAGTQGRSGQLSSAELRPWWK
ncbi:MAG: hypothetical protein ABI778_10285 [Ignavibacteriota bacterium]